jgi:hypothetical protein
LDPLDPADELSRSYYFDSKPICAFEITDIVCHDRAASRGHGKLQYELVARITKRRTPEEMNVLLSSDPAQIVDDSNNVLRAKVQRFRVPTKHRFVFQHQRDGNSNLKPARSQQRQRPKGCASPRPKTGHEHAAVEHDEHLMMVSHAIPHERIATGALGGTLVAEPGESVLREEDFEAMR